MEEPFQVVKHKRFRRKDNGETSLNIAHHELCHSDNDMIDSQSVLERLQNCRYTAIFVMIMHDICCLADTFLIRYQFTHVTVSEMLELKFAVLSVLLMLVCLFYYIVLKQQVVIHFLLFTHTSCHVVLLKAF